ncbi:hypothetical protein [Flavobacterium sp.]|uniref:hypothetical protein n=1 Tax=Flavobacterium sp. TaxID=239 RepID=UPI00260B24AE|nr:hypothetical protein [Flavobacterium sp.]
MTKKETLNNLKEIEEERIYQFTKFMRNEGYVETTDKMGNFKVDSPIYFKKVNEVFFVFNIAFQTKKKSSLPDFLIVIASSENEFTKKKVNQNNVREVIAGFQIDKHYDEYRKIKAAYL